jgi:hypothetical protein
VGTPRNDTYTADAGAGIFGGCPAPSSLAYLAGLNVGQVRAIPGTSPTSVGIDGFCGWTYDSVAKKIRYGAAGGHSDGGDNSVNELALLTDSPSWAITKQATPFAQVNASQPINLDGTPNSVHTYGYTHWAPTRGQMVILGSYAPSPGSDNFNNVHAFSPTTGQWAAANSMDPCQGGHYGNCRIGNGDVWALWGNNSSRYWTEATATWSNPGVTGATTFVRFPWAWDTLRSQAFGLAWGDSQGSDPTTMRAVRLVGSVKADITLSGSGLTQFQADASINGGAHYAGMTYDEANDRFVWYCGMGASAGRLYAIKPTSGTNWTIELLPTTGAVIPATVGGGINSRLTYVDLGSFKGIVFMPGRAAGCYFLRTA